MGEFEILIKRSNSFTLVDSDLSITDGTGVKYLLLKPENLLGVIFAETLKQYHMHVRKCTSTHAKYI